MINELKFISLGLDIRVRPQMINTSADTTVWDQNESMYEFAQRSLGFHENEFQLLQSESINSVRQLASLVDQHSDAVIISLDIIESSAKSFSKDYCSLRFPKEFKWKSLGFDVCDINGFFSYLNMGIESECGLPVLNGDQLLEAFRLSESANLNVKSHRPFVVVQIRQLIRA